MGDNSHPIFDYRLCMACRICLDVCPTGCLEESKMGIDRYGKVFPALVRPKTCISCALCETACPAGAIKMESPA